MPDISKINALAIGSVAKVDGLAKASILDIDGVAVPPAVSAPAAAYSVRLLGSAVGISSYTGPAMRVRRETAGGAGDDDEADVAFNSGVISLDSAISNASVGVTATTLGEFLNVGTVGGTTYSNPDSLTVTASCFVDEWKDQSGNANHATQATHTSQPQIHSGTVNTDLITENGKPAIDWAGNKQLPTPLQGTGGSPAYTSFHVATIHSGGPGILMATTSTSFYAYGVNGDSGSPTSGQYSPATYYGNGSLISSATRGDIYNNHSSQGLLTVQYTGNANTYQFGYISSGFANFNCQECIIYHSDQTSSPTNNRTGIESNINGFFSIYP